MHITEIQTPYVKRRVIEYGAGPRFNTPVRHWHDVQQISGPLYKGREARNRYDELRCTFYLFYEGVEAGLRWMRDYRLTEQDTVEKLLSMLDKNRLSSLESFLALLEDSMESSQWIGQAEIEFVRQFDMGKAERLTQYRQQKLDMQAQASQKRREARQAEKAAKAEIIRQEDLAERRKFLGWADDMSGLRFGQVKKVMYREERCDGKVMTRREFVITQLNNGLIPACNDNGSRMEYRLFNSKRRSWYSVTKTEYDFAKYLLDTGKVSHLDE